MANAWQRLRSLLRMPSLLVRPSDSDSIRPTAADNAPINKLPSELLGDIFQQLSSPRRDSMADIMRVSIGCRCWRVAALSASRIWTKVHLVLDRMDPIFVGRFCKRGAPLPLSFRCDDDGYRTRLDPAIYLVLAVHASGIREFIVPDVNSHFLETLHARDVLTRPFPQLETLWVVRTTPIPTPFLGNCAPNLTMICIPSSAVPLAGDFPALRAVTTFRVMYGLLDQTRLERVLKLCPNLKHLIHAAAFRKLALGVTRYDVALDTLCFFDSLMTESFPAPMLEMLNASCIRHITVLDTHMAAMTLVLAPLRTIVYAVFDYTEGYIELVDERGFVRCFHRCRSWGGEPLRHICKLPSLSWNLQSLAVVGIPPADCPVPPVASIVCLTIGVTQYDASALGFTLTRPCPLLSELRVASYCYKRTDGAAAVDMSASVVAQFIQMRLERSPLRQLRLDSVRLDGDAPSGLPVVHTASVLAPAQYGGDLPYRLDHPWEYEAWRLRRERKQQS